MKCPYCGSIGESGVIDTSHDARDNIRRRRECRNCGRRYSTIERAIVATPLLIKSSGERQEFDHEKLMRGIRVACAKRPVSSAEVQRLVDRIEAHLQSLGRDEVPSKIVGDMIIEELKKLDPIAYIRYAIVYLGLDDLEAVRAETDKLLTERNQQRKQQQSRSHS